MHTYNGESTREVLAWCAGASKGSRLTAECGVRAGPDQQAKLEDRHVQLRPILSEALWLSVCKPVSPAGEKQLHRVQLWQLSIELCNSWHHILPALHIKMKCSLPFRRQCILSFYSGKKDTGAMNSVILKFLMKDAIGKIFPNNPSAVTHIRD